MPGAKKAEQRLFFFMKPPRNAVVGEGDTVRMPIGTKAFDWEVELAAVIGSTARNVPVRRRAAPRRRLDGGGRLLRPRPQPRAGDVLQARLGGGKANDTCCPLGPRIVPFAALAHPQDTG